MLDVSLNVYVLYCFDEVFTSTKPNMMTFSVLNNRYLNILCGIRHFYLNETKCGMPVYRSYY